MSRPADDDETLLERATHDLLNPVASILGLGETIRTRGATLDDATLRQFGESIGRQANRLEGAIKDLIRATRLLRQDTEVAAQGVIVSEVLTQVDRERVRIDVPAGLKIQVDPLLLGDAIRRLVDNALQFSMEEVVISAGAGWIEVADRGTGFTEEGLARAFEPLSAGANAKGERGAGLGLGLYIARRLVEAMGGTLTGAGTRGEGTTFRIELPG